MKAKSRLLTTVVAGFVLSVTAPARLSADEFYIGKTIRFVVGQAAGGGYDLSARTIARHMGKHIPGNPAIVVENMTGAGSLIAANYTFNSAKRTAYSWGLGMAPWSCVRRLGTRP